MQLRHVELVPTLKHITYYYNVQFFLRLCQLVLQAWENVAMESLLPIVASQRERFKIRNMELEAVSYTPGEFLFSF